MARSSKKKKPTARENATKRIAERDRSGGPTKVPASTKKISVSRFPGETPLTGEDRPTNRPGGKQGVREVRKTPTLGRRKSMQSGWT